MNYDKLKILLDDKRVPARSKLVFLLFEKGLSLDEVIHFSADDIDTLRELENGEALFMQYAKGAGVMERIAHSNLIFPGTNGNPMQEVAMLTFLRRACRMNGFQLYELEVEGLVNAPKGMKLPDGFKEKAGSMSFDEIKEFIANQQKK